MELFANNKFAVALGRAWPLLALIIFVVAVTLIGSLGSASLDRTVTTMVINLILVVGLYAFVGLSGVFSFGHMAFMAVGAYTMALFTIPAEAKAFTLADLPSFLSGAHLPTIPATLAAGGTASILAIVVAIPLMRISGLTAALGTFAILIVVNQVTRNWQALTNGTAGISSVPTTTTVLGALVWALLAMIAVFLFQESRFGLRLRASREDEVAAQALGISVPRERGAAFVLSAFVCGVAGALYASLLGGFGPDAFYLQLTFFLIVMLVIGGLKSLAGAVIGTVVVSALSEILRRMEAGIDFGAFRIHARPGSREVGLAVILLLILLLRPSGLMGGREIHWPFGKRLAPRPGNGKDV
jgi:branched-chain amino acid transport system permease protein